MTDHRKHEPSVEAQAAFAGLAHDLQIFRGEEVHAPDTDVHIVNFGGARGVNRLFASDEYAQGVTARAEALARQLPPHVNARSAAACAWVFDAIRADGGLAILCHPYWLTGEVAAQHHNVDAGLMDHLFAKREFDAYELIGGYVRHEREANALQVARWVEDVAHGGPMPIVGASDAHSDGDDHTLGWYWTLVFARSNTLEDILDAVRARRTVVVESTDGGEDGTLLRAGAAGEIRLLPDGGRAARARPVVRRGRVRAMLAHLEGDASARVRLAALSGRVRGALRQPAAADALGRARTRLAGERTMGDSPKTHTDDSGLDSTRRFSDRVADYVRYRPDYPAQAVAFISSGAADSGPDRRWPTWARARAS